MIEVKDFFSIYIIIAMMGIGIYMACLESVYLRDVDHLNKEAIFSKVIGIVYIIVAIGGIVVNVFW
ncbi:MAG: hypothetical protein ATN33_03970 [Epulopiscium sp. Nele67-Bin001]|nr:MAG: hypothetical protein BEN18_09895 [Epulopiscium sp. Nuni2H_MBin001]OON94789.1 MAG: hypothetical protein ATN33_03970 [Epulopiscium sp. Nele67-Bin001]